MANEQEYSPAFKSFILALQEWVDGGAENGKPFRRRDSVCFQIRNYYPQGNNSQLAKRDLRFALLSTTGEEDMPFNTEGGQEDYGAELRLPLGHYGNPARLAWIKMMADKFKEEETK